MRLVVQASGPAAAGFQDFSLPSVGHLRRDKASIPTTPPPGAVLICQETAMKSCSVVPCRELTRFWGPHWP